MNSMDSRIASGGMVAGVGARTEPEPHAGKLPVKEALTNSGPDDAQLNPVQTKVSFTTYGSRNERIAVVVKNRETGEVIREIPSREMQKLHVHLDISA